MARDPFSGAAWFTTQGMFGKVQDGSPIANPIPGTATVLEGNSGWSDLANWTGSYRLRVRVPGRAEFDVAHLSWIIREKHPVRGFQLPITLNADDPTDLRVEWDQAPTMDQRIAQRDPAILDPVRTFNDIVPTATPPVPTPDPRLLDAARAQMSQFLPSSSVLLKALDQSAHPPPEAPWDESSLTDWPPPSVKAGRSAAHALVVSRSNDPYANMFGDSFQPPGTKHFASRGGSISCSKWEYLGWLLLCVVPPYGSRYGLWMRTRIQSRHVQAVLPVTISQTDPNDVEIEWDAVPSIAGEVAELIQTDMTDMHQRVAEIQELQQRSFAAAMTNVQDPVMRAQVEKMAASFGVTMPTTAPPPVAGPTATPTAPASAPARDVTGELGRLQKLHAAGVLTDAEYETQRTRVLNEI
jgi:hypothetical protein